MKAAAALFAACMVARTSGFAPAFTRVTVSTRLFSEPEKSEKKDSEEGLDLDLSDMFEMQVKIKEGGRGEDSRGSARKAESLSSA